MTWWKRWHLYLLLFAIYPAIAFLASNAGQVDPRAMTRPLLFSLVLSLLVLLLLRAILRDWSKAAAGATMVLLVILSYGHIYAALKEAGLSGETVVRHRYLAPVTLVALAAGIVLLARAHLSGSAVATLNLVAAIALAGPILQLAGYYWPQLVAAGHATAPAQECTLSVVGDTPDVYLIILDAYERDDVLLEMHGYDNSWFLEALEARGFYIARGSLSNYRHTELSLAATLNSTYIQDFPERFSTIPNHQWEIVQRINHNSLRNELECLDYSTVAFESGVFWTEWTDADYFIQRGSGGLDDIRSLGRLSRSDVVFLDTTLVRVAFDAMRQELGSNGRPRLDVNEEYRDRIQFVFSQLGDVASLPPPKLVFVHILSPHPPFVFGPNGELISEGDFETENGEARTLRLYADQVNYLNQRVLEAVDGILSRSRVPPVIVIMGDHGWADRNSEDKLSILNAYHLPGVGNAALYPTITPVNTFRVILDAYFGGRYGLLEDASYFSYETDVFGFQLVQNSWEP